MIVKFDNQYNIELMRWICKIIEEMVSERVITNPNFQCEVEFEGGKIAWLQIKVAKLESVEIAHEVMSHNKESELERADFPYMKWKLWLS
jgi:hypothetical protein